MIFATEYIPYSDFLSVGYEIEINLISIINLRYPPLCHAPSELMPHPHQLRFS